MLRKRKMIGIVYVSVLLTTFFLSSIGSFLVGVVYGSADVYGNQILWLAIYQWDGDSWELLQNVTSDASWTQRVVDSQPINFTVRWRLNNTLVSNIAEAVSYTRITMNITGIWTDNELNNISSDTGTNWYYGVELGHWNQTGYPQSGVTYDVDTKYEAYY